MTEPPVAPVSKRPPSSFGSGFEFDSETNGNILKDHFLFPLFRSPLLPSPDVYLYEAGRAEAEAVLGREIAVRLSRASLRSHLDHTRGEFTVDVWESEVATLRQEELAVHARRLRYAHDDLDDLVAELWAFADHRETDAGYFRQRYHAELLEEAAESGGPS